MKAELGRLKAMLAAAGIGAPAPWQRRNRPGAAPDAEPNPAGRAAG